MKTAISLPDPLFEAGERAAVRLGLSRSELYAKALASFLKEHEGEAVTLAINRALGGARPRLDPVLAGAQAASLGPDEGGLDDRVDLRKREPRRGAKRG